MNPAQAHQAAAGSRPPRSGRLGFWAQVAQLVRPWHGLLVVAASCVLGAALAGVVPPLIIRHVVNDNLVPRNAAGLLSAGLAYLGAVAAVAGFGYAYSYLAAVVAQRAIATIRVGLFAHLARLPVSYYDRTPLGDTISRATSDVETIDTLFTDGIATLVGQLASLIMVAVAMVAISPVLSAVSLLVIPPLALASRWLQLRVLRAERATRIAIGGLNTQLSETVGGSETIQAFGREAAFAARFRDGLRQTLSAQERSIRYNAFFAPVTGLLSALAIAGLLWVGAGGLFRSASVNLGTLVAFVLLFQGFFAPIVALGDQWNAVQAALAGAERVFEVLNLPPEAPPSGHAAAPSGKGIAVSGVRFGYNDGNLVLQDVSLAVRPGEQVAVVGRTGPAGKSTLLALLGGLYQPSAGEIRIAGRRPGDIAGHERRRTVGIVPQHVQLFSGSVRDNLTLGDGSISDDAIRGVLTLTGLEPLIAAMPDGLDTIAAGSGGESRRGPFCRAAPAGGTCPGARHRTGSAPPRRGDRRNRRRERRRLPVSARPNRLGTRLRRPHRRSPDLDRPRRRPRRGHGSWADHRAGHPRESRQRGRRLRRPRRPRRGALGLVRRGERSICPRPVAWRLNDHHHRHVLPARCSRSGTGRRPGHRARATSRRIGAEGHVRRRERGRGPRVHV